MTRDQIKKIKRMPTRELEEFLVRFYREAFIDGLREGESEFDDDLILTEDEAREQFGAEAVERALEGIR